MTEAQADDHDALDRLLELIEDADYVPENVRSAAKAVRQERSSSRGVIEVPVGTPLASVERLLIDETLRRTGGNRQRTADLLGVAARTIYRKLASVPGQVGEADAG